MSHLPIPGSPDALTMSVDVSLVVVDSDRRQFMMIGDVSYLL